MHCFTVTLCNGTACSPFAVVSACLPSSRQKEHVSSILLVGSTFNDSPCDAVKCIRVAGDVVLSSGSTLRVDYITWGERDIASWQPNLADRRNHTISSRTFSTVGVLPNKKLVGFARRRSHDEWSHGRLKGAPTGAEKTCFTSRPDPDHQG